MALFFSEAGSSPCEPSKNEKKKGFNLFRAWIPLLEELTIVFDASLNCPCCRFYSWTASTACPFEIGLPFHHATKKDGHRRIPRKPLEHALGFFRALWNFVVCHVLREMLVLIWRLVLLISLGTYKTLCLKILLYTSTFFRAHLLL